MGEAVKLPGTLRAPAIEWRARQINDPVERLRYLRRAAGGPTRASRSTSRYRIWAWRASPAVALIALVFVASYSPSRARVIRAVAAHEVPGTVRTLPEIWPVEQSSRFDLYSNGLRIENEFAVSNQPRRGFPVYRVRPAASEAGDAPLEWRTQPVGIVFHATESHQAAFNPSELHDLKRIGRNLLEYVRTQRSYHFVIDRFGRVYRIVNENDMANHAGKSIWADARGAYVNLNASFLSVALESQTDANHPLNDAQIHAVRILTDMLRSRFHLPASNCVTHAQVSVNPSNMRIGYHTDWASGFPFAQAGLPDNYSQRVASLAVFGFAYDGVFMTALGTYPWQGLAIAERSLEGEAGTAGVSPEEYRKRLQQRYRRIINAQLRMTEENQDESQ